MRNVVIIFVLYVAFALEGFAKDESNSKKVEWITDYGKALKVAADEGKTVLADFSGSDWCGWCIKLKKEVFTKKEFLKYADKNLVLLLVDFPMRKEQAEAVRKQNEKLKSKYMIRGFPTVLLLDKKGKVIGKTGYRPGGPDEYVKHLRDMIGVKD